MSNPVAPTLTIAIPTYNRAEFLAKTLGRIQEQRAQFKHGEVELLVCDNHSNDATAEVLADFAARDPSLRVLRHDANIGPDRNTATCFMQARGQYVWILGDDDIPVDGLLARLLDRLKPGRFGLIYLRPYGYDVDDRAERPPSPPDMREYSDVARFLGKVGAHLTFISSIIVSKDFAGTVDFLQCDANNLLQLEIYLRAAERAERFLYVSGYCVACKRNNSGGYNFSKVFVTTLSQVLERHVRDSGLPAAAAKSIQNSMLLSYYPQRILLMRLRGEAGLSSALSVFHQQFGGSRLFRLLLRPIFTWPRWAAVAWGSLWTLIGRCASGDLTRGIYFAIHALKQALSARSTT
jgi:glycosyltransferase involved in cell wall biosynthesis